MLGRSSAWEFFHFSFMIKCIIKQHFILVLFIMSLGAINARGPRAIPARTNKVTSNEVRRLICLASHDETLTVGRIARTFNVEPYIAGRIIARYELDGLTDKLPQGGIKPKL